MHSPLENISQPAVSTKARTASRLVLAATAACALTVVPARAQQVQQVAYSTSSNHALLAGEDIDGTSLGSAPSPEPAASASSAALPSPQYGGGHGGYSGYHESRWSHVAFEAGGGFTAPVGNDVNGGFTTVIGDGNNYGTNGWGGNILVGGGWAFTKKFTLLGEYQFNSSKIPGRTLSTIYNAFNNSDPTDFSGNGIDSIGGSVHTNSITAEPMFYYYNGDKHKYAGYVIGGVGWYHKTINFTAPVAEETYYGTYVQNQTFSSYSDSGVGFNFGTGVSFKPFGSDSRAKLFGEVRYVFADTPSETQAEATNPNSTVIHTGTEELIPVTFGIRF